MDYAAEVRRLTGGQGVDIVLDPLGGRDWSRGLALLRPVGRLVAFGFASLTSGERRRPLRVVSQVLRVPLLTPLGLMARNRTVSGVNIGHLWGERALLLEELQALVALWRAGSVRPRVDAVFPFAEAAAAHRRLTERRNVGKVILVP